MSKAYEKLRKPVLEASVSNIWEEAVYEWDIIDCDCSESCSGICICGKHGLKYMYRIRNRKNHNELYPIGSECIKRFGVKELNEEMTIREAFFRLLHEWKEYSFISLNSQLFTKKLLHYFLTQGVFCKDEFNKSAEAEYNFMVEMFLTRKDNITPRQHAKIKAILVNKIIPYLEWYLYTSDKKKYPYQNKRIKFNLDKEKSIYDENSTFDIEDDDDEINYTIKKKRSSKRKYA